MTPPGNPGNELAYFLFYFLHTNPKKNQGMKRYIYNNEW